MGEEEHSHTTLYKTTTTQSKMNEEPRVLADPGGNGPSITIISFGVPTGAPAPTFAEDDETDNDMTTTNNSTTPGMRIKNGRW